MKLLNAVCILSLATSASAGRMNEKGRDLEDSLSGKKGYGYAGKKGYGYAGKKGYGYAGKKGGPTLDECLTGKKGSYTSGKKGAGGKGAGKGGGVITIPDYGDSCVICDKQNKNKPQSLVLQYVADGENSAFQPAGKATCREGTYPSPARIEVNGDAYEVEDGDLFEVFTDGGAETDFKIVPTGQSVFDEDIECYIHTSCSVPIVVGDQIGPFLIEGQEDCELPPMPEEEDCPDCSICDTGRPEELTMIYRNTGVNSEYQPADKATCRAGMYPDPVLVTFGGDSMYQLSDGDEFTVAPKYSSGFPAELTVEFTDHEGLNCFIHTSCSVPLVPGDQIGPFEIVGDEDCGPPEVVSRCITAEVGEDADGNTEITVDFDYSDLDGDRIWAENCDSRDSVCPDFSLQPLPSDWIGFYPCDEKDSLPMAFSVEPDFWAYTCLDRACRSDPVDTATTVGPKVFSDATIPPFGQQGVYKSIADIEAEGGGCYVVLLNKMDGFSPPPYYNLCMGNEIMLPDRSR
mmetsp:Transcript_14762/g.22539  ORF Transcript_14762/g.22539 Transcript_14762/m.22539 type:complete len:516 (-) Transcript_14762:130-1677(-)